MGMPSLNWQLQLHFHNIVRHIPVEYLQLWRGLFAGIRLKVRGQGTILRMGCFASVCHRLRHSPPKHKPKAEKAPAPAKAAATKKALAKAEDKPKAAKAAPTKKAPAKAAAVDYSKMTVAQLKVASKEKGIEGYTSLKKAELIAALENK